jgi:hypothetical protein
MVDETDEIRPQPYDSDDSDASDPPKLQYGSDPDSSGESEDDDETYPDFCTQISLKSPEAARAHYHLVTGAPIKAAPLEPLCMTKTKKTARVLFGDSSAIVTPSARIEIPSPGSPSKYTYP